MNVYAQVGSPPNGIGSRVITHRFFIFFLLSIIHQYCYS